MMSKAFTCLLVLLVAQLCTMATAVSIQKRQAPNTVSAPIRCSFDVLIEAPIML